MKSVGLFYFVTTKKRFEKNGYYIHTLSELGKQINIREFSPRIAHIKTFPGEENEAKLAKTYLEKNGFEVITSVSSVNPHSKENYPQYINGYKEDIIKCFRDPRFHKSDYCLWLEDDSPVYINEKSEITLEDSIEEAVYALETKYNLCSVYYNRGTSLTKDTVPAIKAKEGNLIYHDRDFTFQPNISRVKDLYYAANVLAANIGSIGHIHNEMAFTMCMKSLFIQDYSIGCFDPKKLCSLHMAHENFVSVEGEKEKWRLS
jgi:hypothetical protein